MTNQDTASRRRRTMWIALLAVAVAAAVVAALVALNPADPDDDRAVADSTSTSTSTSAPTPTPTSTSSAPATPEQTPETVSPPPVVAPQVEGAPPSFEPVGLEDAVEAGQGITAELSSVTAIQASATGPGNVDGPALAVTVRITNHSDAPVGLADVEVALTYTAEEWSASPVDDDAAAPLTGMLAGGRSVQGTYVFSVPVDQRDVVTVTVGLAAGAPLLVFTGAVA